MKTRLVQTAVVAAFALTAAAASAAESCSYTGTQYSDGATVCQEGTQFRCDDGDWKSLAINCAAKDVAAPAPTSCEYKGTSFSSGAASCQSGTQYRCEAGSWRSMGSACPPEQVAAPRVIPPSGRTCMMEGGSTVASGSTVCRSGVMFACEDGDWRNIGTPCQ